jgi:hypothetical protein
LRLRKERNRFHFYFGDSLELCLTNQELHNKVHVIHCSAELVKYAGLANILSSVTFCLNDIIPEAIVVTELKLCHFEGKIHSLMETLEAELLCSTTMIPAIYDVRLLDHVYLGNSVCHQLHDRYIAPVCYTLKWCKTDRKSVV